MSTISRVWFLFIICAMVFFANSAANATSISLMPANSVVSPGDSVDIQIIANIDPSDAIIAFGFDLALTGDNILSFSGFNPNAPTFGTDPGHQAISDIDGILGDSGGDFLFGLPVSGNDVLLGTLSFAVTGVGNAVVGLGADDLDVWFTEGLIPSDVTKTNFMPSVATASVVSAVPEPATILLLGVGLAGVGLFRRRFKN